MFEITEEPLHAGRIAAAIRRDEDGCVVTFEGVVRNHNRGKQVLYLEYEAYPEMALSKMREIAAEISARWGLDHVALVHRVGRIEVGETSVVIAVAAPHRDVAYEASRYAIDRLKMIVPVWKKEVYADGEVWLGMGN